VARAGVTPRKRLPQNAWPFFLVAESQGISRHGAPDRQPNGLGRPAGNPAVSERPAAFRPTLADGLAFTTGRPY